MPLDRKAWNVWLKERMSSKLVHEKPKRIQHILLRIYIKISKCAFEIYIYFQYFLLNQDEKYDKD